MSVSILRSAWTRWRLAVIVSVLLALVVGGAVAARADQPAAATGGTLSVVAIGQPPGSDEWVQVPAYVLAGEDVHRGGFTLQVGPSAYLSLFDWSAAGGTSELCRNGYRWVFKSWNEHPSDDVNPDEWYESTNFEVHGVHDVPGQGIDHYLTLWFVPECL